MSGGNLNEKAMKQWWVRIHVVTPSLKLNCTFGEYVRAKTEREAEYAGIRLYEGPVADDTEIEIVSCIESDNYYEGH